MHNREGKNTTLLYIRKRSIIRLLGLAEGGDDKSVQGTARRGIRIGVAIDLSLVFFVALLPLSSLLLVVQDSGGLADTVAKRLATC